MAVLGTDEESEPLIGDARGVEVAHYMDDVIEAAGHGFLLSVGVRLDVSMLSLPGLTRQSKISVT
jgi:hypothetical protein